MNVLSLFDGMSCGQITLQRLGIQVDNYFACEIDKWAIKVTQNNFPNTVQLGSVTELHGIDMILPKIDLVIGGSPCQGFSFAGKQLNFDDPRSMLFFEFVRILDEVREINPDVKFLLENVRMKKEYQNVISEYMGVQPIEVNSALVSAQNRKRLYWTNIPDVTQPEDKGILLRDIIHENTDIGPETDSHIRWFKKNAAERLKKKYCALDPEKAITMTARQYANWNGNFVMEELVKYIVPFDKTLQILNKEVERGKIGYFHKDNEENRVYYIHDTEVDIYEVKDPYLFGCITPDRIEKKQNGQRFNEGKKFYTLTAQDRHGILIEGYIRKLTPIECERLQTVPDHYTDCVSNSQRYKMLGNGWTVDVIAHIFKNL
ncbi:DNA methyltransferase [Croceibacter phage P2559Y]|uniref:DNA methyltransferase n=1 Tax=Croceibacter phage P2559Y TaxID=1327037 RepID=UPI0003F4AC56|nr:DNA methyltransferase [Croceibacter phage P2559Y]AGM14104.1 DNA methyltransferase [Croceibacter phage P2559Y]